MQDFRTQHKPSSVFPISDKFVDATFNEVEQGGREIFTRELQFTLENNPYLFAVVLQVAHIFETDKVEIACIQGALFIHYLVYMSTKKNGIALPFVTEDHMVSLVDSMRPTEESLETFVAQEIAIKKRKGDSVLFAAAHKARHGFGFEEKELLAFCIGMILAYNVLERASL